LKITEPFRGHAMDSVPHFIPVVILCTIHLLAGLGIGFLIWAGVQCTPSHVAQLEDKVQFYCSAFDRFTALARRVHSLVEIQGPLVPDPLIKAIRNLSRATRDIQEQAKAGKRSPPWPAASGRDERHAMSKAEIHSVLASSHLDLASDSEEMEAERHAYHVSQWMGRCAGHRLPATDEFEQVMCYDLSSTGVSFYAEDVQIGQNVVIAIGRGDSPMFVLSEVMNRRVVTQKDELTYLIGCRFRRRLNPETDGEILEEYNSLPFQAGITAAN
jgi:hypothetical protein